MIEYQTVVLYRIMTLQIVQLFHVLMILYLPLSTKRFVKLMGPSLFSFIILIGFFLG